MRRRLLLMIAVLPLCLGCRAGFMVTRILMGDPQIPSVFESVTEVDLEEEDRPVYVICTAPSVMTEEYESLSVDLPDELRRRLRRRGIRTEDASDAINETVDFGGRLNAYDIGKHLDEGFLVYVNLERYTLSEDGGNTLYRGRAAGELSVFEIAAPDDEASSSDERTVTEIFSRGFETTYPGAHPIPVDQLPARVFQKRFVDHLTDLVGRMIYSYQATDTF